MAPSSPSGGVNGRTLVCSKSVWEAYRMSGIRAAHVVAELDREGIVARLGVRQRGRSEIGLGRVVVEIDVLDP